jgi:molybdopterin synthase sulfur carrier subunit
VSDADVDVAAAAPAAAEGADTAEIRLALPHHLRNLAGVGKELRLAVARTSNGDVTLEGVVAALEARFPMLRGTLRDPTSGGRRAYVRFFASRRDLSHEAMTAALPREVAEGEEVLIVLGAMSGG